MSAHLLPIPRSLVVTETIERLFYFDFKVQCSIVRVNEALCYGFQVLQLHGVLTSSDVTSEYWHWGRGVFWVQNPMKHVGLGDKDIVLLQYEHSLLPISRILAVTESMGRLFYFVFKVQCLIVRVNEAICNGFQVLQLHGVLTSSDVTSECGWSVLECTIWKKIDVVLDDQKLY